MWDDTGSRSGDLALSVFLPKLLKCVTHWNLALVKEFLPRALDDSATTYIPAGTADATRITDSAVISELPLS